MQTNIKEGKMVTIIIVILAIISIIFGLIIVMQSNKIAMLQSEAKAGQSKTQAFLSHVSNLVPNLTAICYRQNIQKIDLGSVRSRYFDIDKSFSTLTQSCGVNSTFTWSITFTGIGKYRGISVYCSKKGCNLL